ncbi:MAG: c-type cytochrome [Verrucomicrobia bacterium]|nr:c-type cytochrome [Verrucomicrobiota bacterium]
MRHHASQGRPIGYCRGDMEAVQTSLNLALLLSTGLSAIAQTPRPKTGQPWVDMDYGPFLTASIEAPAPRTNIAYKGIAINLGAAEGTSDNEAIVFDTDLLRYAAGWTGNFVALKGVVFDGEHWAYPAISGRQLFGNPMRPGWAKAGSFHDPRAHPFGPLPRDWARWRGLYLHERQVILSYTVGDTAVLELPGLERQAGLVAFARTLNLGPSDVDRVVQVAFDDRRRPTVLRAGERQRAPPRAPVRNTLIVLAPPSPATALEAPAPASLDQGLAGHWEFNEAKGPTAADRSAHRRVLDLQGTAWTSAGHTGAALAFDGRHSAEIRPAHNIDFVESDLTLAAWVQCREDGTILAQTAPTDRWVPNGRAWFIRGGRLTFDVGWVGAVASSASVTDGQWHHVAMTWAHSDGRVTLYVDGVLDGTAQLKPRQPLPDQVTRLGFSAPNFPAAPWFRGALDELRVYRRILSVDELGALARRAPPADVLALAAVGAASEARWLLTEEGHVRLLLPAQAEPARVKILLWSGLPEALAAFAQLAATASPPADIEPLTRGGPARWGERLVTRAQLGSADGPYAIDTLTEPDPNPWNSWLRFGGIDFFSDGARAALCTWNGDVWVVSGLGVELGRLTWQRIATGLYQPLGLAIVQDCIYVLGRDQITRLHDLDGDGETDYYENFNNDCMTGEHFHEFALDLKVGPDGDFYYIKCACHAVAASHPHHGTLMRVSRDGARLEVVARGLRAANGLGVGPHLEFTSIDNQGYWMPANRLNWMKPGGWYGNQLAWNPENRTTYDEPLCWMHNFVDRSGGTQLWVPTDRWGPIEGELITISYGMGHMFLVLKEDRDGLMQGGVTRFPLDFPTGVMRGAFHPKDHQLYTCGLYGWAGNKTRAGGFYRVRFTGRPLHLPHRLEIAQDGILLGFTDPLDVASATDPGNYDLKCWNYRWTAQYGSPDLRRDGREGRDTLRIESATLGADRRTVFLEVPTLQPVMQSHLVFNLKGADGTAVRNFVHHTIHRLGSVNGLQLLGSGSLARVEAAATRLELEAPSLSQTLRATGPNAADVPTDTRRARLAALYVEADQPVSPFLRPGPFAATWTGFLKMDLNEERVFETAGRGGARLTVNGAVVLAQVGPNLDGVRSPPTPLRSGLNRFELEYLSPASGPAEVRLLWSSPQLPPEPVPPTAFVHDDGDPALRTGEAARAGRDLFAASQCVKCHQPSTPWGPDAMPDLTSDAPAFDGIGDRLQPAWLAQWLLDPKAVRSDARMPRLLAGEAAVRDARDLAAWLASLRGAQAGVAAVVEANGKAEVGLVGKGQQLFTGLACVACHRFTGDPLLTDDPRVRLDHLAAKWQPRALEAFLRAPTQHFPWTRMPDFKLTGDEASALAAYLESRALAPEPVAAPEGEPVRGLELAGSLGCLNCHTLEGTVASRTAPGLTDLWRRDWTRGCLAADLEARGTAPDFGFTATEREALERFASMEPADSLARSVPAEFAARQYAALRCQACHPRDHETDFLASLPLAAPATATAYGDEDEGGGSSVHLGRPPLTFAGEKLYAGWVQRFLDGSLPYKPRPELQGRMPAFPAYASGLAVGLAHEHGYRAESAATTVADPELAAIGRRLTEVGEGFSCVACHDVGAQKALAGKDTATVNFACVTERLRPSYYWRYVQDPPHLLPSTMMPKFIADDGTTPIKSVYDGDPQRQFNAIWHYLLTLRPEAGAR